MPSQTSSPASSSPASSLASLSSQPSAYNNYKASSSTVLDYKLWNATVGDLALRMAKVEVKATGYDALVAEGIGIALERIDLSLAPAVGQVQALIDQTDSYLTQLKANTIGAALIVTTPTMRFVSDGQISKIGQIDTLQGTTNALLANALLRGRSFYYATM